MLSMPFPVSFPSFVVWIDGDDPGREGLIGSDGNLVMHIDPRSEGSWTADALVL